MPGNVQGKKDRVGAGIRKHVLPNSRSEGAKGPEVTIFMQRNNVAFTKPDMWRNVGTNTVVPT